MQQNMKVRQYMELYVAYIQCALHIKIYLRLKRLSRNFNKKKKLKTKEENNTRLLSDVFHSTPAYRQILKKELKTKKTATFHLTLTNSATSTWCCVVVIEDLKKKHKKNKK